MFRTAKDCYVVNEKEGCGDAGVRTFQQQTASSSTCTSWRYSIAALSFLAGCMVNLQRMCLAVAMVKMINFNSTSVPIRNLSLTTCPVIHNTTGDSVEYQAEGEFNWSSKVQGLILGAGFLGYSLTPVVGGNLAEKFGAKRMVFIGNSLAALGMLISPIASSWHAYALIAAQLLRGVGQGFVIPSTFRMMANWAPRKERGFLSSLVFTGLYSGCMLGGTIAGFICETDSLGWRGSFYFFGGIGMLYSVLFLAIFYETPSDHPRISETEMKYIISDQESKQNSKRPPTPWFRMFTSIRTGAVLCGMFGQYWAVSYFITVHPAYLNNVLHFSISENGMLSSIPFLLIVIGTVTASSTSDWLYRKKYVGVDKLRKGCNSMGCLGFSLSMAGVYVAKCNTMLNVIFFATALLSVGISTPGSRITAVDMTPNFAATLMGVLATFCALSGLIIPLVTGHLTKRQALEEWQTMFLINIVVLMSTGIVFAVFGSAEVQSWNFASDSDGTEKTKKLENSSKTTQTPTEIQMKSSNII